MKSKLRPATLQGSPLREQAEVHGCSNSLVTEPTTELTTEPIDRRTSSNTFIPQHSCRRVVGEEDHRAEAAASPPGARASTRKKIRKICGKRRAGKGYEYKMRWKST